MIFTISMQTNSKCTKLDKTYGRIILLNTDLSIKLIFHILNCNIYVFVLESIHWKFFYIEWKKYYNNFVSV